MKEIFLCLLTELDGSEYLIKFIEELKDEIIVFRDRQSGEINVFSSVCPHFGGPLVLKDNVLFCKWHSYEFSKSSGNCISHKLKLTALKYKTVIKQNQVLIEAYE